MSTAADTTFLDKALGELEAARRWSPRTISKFEAFIGSTDPWALYRVDPLRYAAEKGMEQQEAIDLFLYATHFGLFNIEWRLICPQCSDTITSCRSMKTLKSSCFCQLCQMGVEANLDDYIGVAFNLSQRVRELNWHKPENLSAADYLLKYRIDSRASFEGMGKMTEILASFCKFIDHLKPGEEKTIDTEVPPGWAAIAYDVPRNRAVMWYVEGSQKPVSSQETVRAEVGADNWKISRETIAAGPLRITLANPTPEPVAVALYVRPNEGDGPKLELGEFLRGNRLLNSQTFRTLFRAETLATGEGMGLRDLTLLFTDLKGSTELYERVGDLAAFALVQQHFEHLRRAVEEQQGAVVKTIGDAVMASFAKPEQAVKSALSMYREIEQFNTRRGTRDLILKIGIHRGPSIAVTLNDRLDYFGQTVNIAARVQGIANADEVCLTDEVIESNGVRGLLDKLKVGEEWAKLKGIAGTMKVYRVALS